MLLVCSARTYFVSDNSNYGVFNTPHAHTQTPTSTCNVLLSFSLYFLLLQTPTNTCNALLATETHGPYQHGDGHKTVNSGGGDGLFNANVPPPLDPSYNLGTECPGTVSPQLY